MIGREELQHRFGFHPASSQDTRDAHERVRDACLGLALGLDLALPDGREKSLAITSLEQTMFWANAAIARHGTG